MAHDDAAKRIFEIATRFEPKMRVALRGAFEQMRGLIPEKQILEALQTQGYGGVLRLIDEADYSGALNGFRDEIENAAAESGRVFIETIPGAAIVNPAFRYSTVNPGTAEFVRNYSLNLIRQISNNTREAARNSIEADAIAGRGPKDTARNFRNTVGLTAKQERAVRRYRESLSTLDRDALARALRDKRFDPSVLRAIESGAALKPDQIDKMVGRYQERYVKYRSEVIARTESLRAASVGQHAAMRQALAQRAVDDTQLRRFWVFARDSRTRDAHRAIPGMNPNGVRLDEPYQSPLGPIMFPRDPSAVAANTVQCRCAERFALASDMDRPAQSTMLAPKPLNTVKPTVAKPVAAPASTGSELRSQWQSMRDKYGDTPETVASRVRWAKSLTPAELLEARAEVMREVSVFESSVSAAERAAFNAHSADAARWIPYDVLADMQSQGYRLRVSGKNIRPYNSEMTSHVNIDSPYDTISHEFSHAYDYYRGGKTFTGRPWEKGAYQDIYHKLRAEAKGTYPNGDGEFWLGPWKDPYEGRIYSLPMGQSDGVEFWGVNCQRYAKYRYEMEVGYTKRIDSLTGMIRRAEQAGDLDKVKKYKNAIKVIQGVGPEKYAAAASDWKYVRENYGGMAEFIENLFGSDFNA